MINKNFKDMLRALLEEKVKFLLVGGYAVSAHGYLRGTADIDFWVMPDTANAEALIRALAKFGAPFDNIEKSDFEKEYTIFQIGVPPERIDFMTTVDGLDFQTAYAHSSEWELDGIPVQLISKEDLIKNKKTSGRYKDLADAEALEKGEY